MERGREERKKNVQNRESIYDKIIYEGTKKRNKHMTWYFNRLFLGISHLYGLARAAFLII